MQPRHGQNSWALERYSWDKKSGMARLTYERADGKETQIVLTVQPKWAQEPGMARYVGTTASA